MERRATVKFQGEELEEWEALLEVERRKLKEDMEVWRHNNKIKNIQITQRTQTERQTRKQRLARLESEVAADKLLYPEPPAIRNEGGALKWQRVRVKLAMLRSGEKVLVPTNLDETDCVKLSSNLPDAAFDRSCKRPITSNNVPTQHPPERPRRSETISMKHRRYRKVQSPASTKKEYIKAKKALRNVLDAKYLFDGDIPHDTDGDINTRLNARHQRDVAPTAATAHGNFRSEGRLTLYDDQVTFRSQSDCSTSDEHLIMNSPGIMTEPVVSSDSSEPSVESDDDKISVKSGGSLLHDTVLNGRVNKIAGEYNIKETLPMSTAGTLREM
jgi:hypothetical protein